MPKGVDVMEYTPLEHLMFEVVRSRDEYALQALCAAFEKAYGKWDDPKRRRVSHG